MSISFSFLFSCQINNYFFFVWLVARRKTIYEYHKVNFGSQDIKNFTVIHLYAQPTCQNLTDCASCLNDMQLKCNWCPTINRCSTGVDRKRQDWLQKGCDKTLITDTTTCPAIGEKGNNYGQPMEATDISNPSVRWENTDGTIKTDSKESEHVTQNSPTQSTKVGAEPIVGGKNEESASFGMVIGVLMPIVLIMSSIVWVFYAYRNPHTKSGQLLIQVNIFLNKFKICL